MLIDPDFPNHWRVEALARALGDDPGAIGYILRIWGHCQTRKSDTFSNLPPVAIASICRYLGEPVVLFNALIDTEFIEVDEAGTVHVPKWAIHNTQLIKAWVNGAKGGRPRKKPPGSESETHGLEKKTHGVSLHITDRIGLDGIGDDLTGDEGEKDISLSSENPTSKPEPEEPLTEHTFTTSGNPREWTLTQAKLDQWTEAYPGVDVPGEMRKAVQWTDAATKRKTARGMPRFLVNWLNRATDNGRGQKATATPKPAQSTISTPEPIEPEPETDDERKARESQEVKDAELEAEREADFQRRKREHFEAKAWREEQRAAVEGMTKEEIAVLNRKNAIEALKGRKGSDAGQAAGTGSCGRDGRTGRDGQT